MVECSELELNSENFDPYDNVMRYAGVMLCPNTTSLVMQGNFGTQQFKYITIDILGCNQTALVNETCFTKEEVKQYFASKEIQYVKLETHIDFTQRYREDVIKYTTDYNDYFWIDTDAS